MVSDTQTLEGVTSLQPDGKHILFWDLEKCSLSEAEETLREVQHEYSLSNIYIFSDAEGSYRAWCFSRVDFKTYLLTLLKTKYLDWNFFWWTVKRGKATLRTSNKQNREPQRLVSVLESYPHPFPKRMEKVEYDTGVEKEGISILLDVLTEDHVFRLEFRKPEVDGKKTGFTIKLGR
jgi:hypothetical protein